MYISLPLKSTKHPLIIVMIIIIIIIMIIVITTIIVAIMITTMIIILILIMARAFAHRLRGTHPIVQTTTPLHTMKAVYYY